MLDARVVTAQGKFSAAVNVDCKIISVKFLASIFFSTSLERVTVNLYIFLHFVESDSNPAVLHEATDSRENYITNVQTYIDFPFHVGINTVLILSIAILITVVIVIIVVLHMANFPYDYPYLEYPLLILLIFSRTLS